MFWPPGFHKSLKCSSQNLYSKHFYDSCWIWNCCFCSFRDFDPRTLANQEKKRQFFCQRRCFIPLVCQSSPNVCISQLLCYSSCSWQRLGVSACAQLFAFLLSKFGPACENKTDVDKKRIFDCKLSTTWSEAHRSISILKIPLYDTNSWARIACLCLCPVKNFYPQKQLHMAMA